MRLGRLMPLFCSAALIAATPLALRAAPTAPPVVNPVVTQSTAPLRIAVANPSYIFGKMQETTSLRDQLEARRKELYAKEVEKRGAIEALGRQRGEINPSHPQYRDLSEKIDQAKADLQSWGSVTRAAAERDQKAMVKNLYDKIEAAIGEIAQQDGLDLVIMDGRQDVGNVEEMNFDELRRILNSRNVLYANKRIDISEKVITVLDAKFAKQKK